MENEDSRPTVISDIFSDKGTQPHLYVSNNLNFLKCSHRAMENSCGDGERVWRADEIVSPKDGEFIYRFSESHIDAGIFDVYSGKVKDDAMVPMGQFPGWKDRRATQEDVRRIINDPLCEIVIKEMIDKGNTELILPKPVIVQPDLPKYKPDDLLTMEEARKVTGLSEFEFVSLIYDEKLRAGRKNGLPCFSYGSLEPFIKE